VVVVCMYVFGMLNFRVECDRRILPAFVVVLFIFRVLCTKCRIIDNYESLELCGPYLRNETLYYNPSSHSEELIRTLFGILYPVLSSDCASNLLALVCRNWFRECREVPTDSAVGSVMMPMPSLIVREVEVITPQKPSDNSHFLCARAVPIGM
jgi:hypothetical protein